MEKEDFIKITFAVWRVMDCLLERELSQKTKKLANQILANLILLNFNPFPQRKKILFETLKEIDQLFSLFGAAKAKAQINPLNFLVLEREYDKIRKDLEKELKREIPTKIILPKRGEKNRKLAKDRKEKILEVLKEKKNAKISELIQIFPQVSRRTLIRDLEDLLHQGIVEKNGSGRGSYYAAKL